MRFHLLNNLLKIKLLLILCLCFCPFTWGQRKPEVHLFIIWNAASHKEKEIIEDISKNLKIAKAYKIQWSPKKIIENISRLYEITPEQAKYKAEYCGHKPFVALVVIDEHPKYKIRVTGRGHQSVNTNIYDLKVKYRSWTGGGHKIHATDSVKEAKHDLLLLLHKPYKQVLSEATQRPWQPEQNFILHKKDLIGSGGWNSLREMFTVLNETVPYVILRHYETLPDHFFDDYDSVPKKPDIDLIVEDEQKAAYALNAHKAAKHIPENRAFHILLKNRRDPIKIDLITPYDQYLCVTWKRHILENKKLHKKIIWVPSDEDYLYSLIYHLIVHKKQAHPKYAPIISYLYKTKAPKGGAKTESPLLCDLYTALEGFMKKNGYHVTKPFDPVVPFNEEFMDYQLGMNRDFLRKTFNLKDIHPVILPKKSIWNSVFKATTPNGKLVFVKINDKHYPREFFFLERNYQKNTENFLRPYWYYHNHATGKTAIVLEYVEGLNLEKYMLNKTLTQPQFSKIYRQLASIGKVLLDTKTCHRDIRPENIHVGSGTTLKLVDFQFAINLAPDAPYNTEPALFQTNPVFLRGLGETYSFPELGVFDDIYSLLKVLDFVAKEDPEKLKNPDYIKTKRFLEKNIGTLRYAFPKEKIVEPPKAWIKKKLSRIKVRLKKLKTKLRNGLLWLKDI